MSGQYHQYRHGRYPIPNDDKEQNRDDMKHAMMLELTEYVQFLHVMLAMSIAAMLTCAVVESSSTPQ